MRCRVNMRKLVAAAARRKTKEAMVWSPHIVRQDFSSFRGDLSQSFRRPSRTCFMLIACAILIIAFSSALGGGFDQSDSCLIENAKGFLVYKGRQTTSKDRVPLKMAVRGDVSISNAQNGTNSSVSFVGVLLCEENIGDQEEFSVDDFVQICVAVNNNTKCYYSKYRNTVMFSEVQQRNRNTFFVTLLGVVGFMIVISASCALLQKRNCFRAQLD